MWNLVSTVKVQYWQMFVFCAGGLTSENGYNAAKKDENHTLLEHSWMTQRNIVKECNVSVAAVNKLIHQRAETGSLSPRRKDKCGQKEKQRTEMTQCYSGWANWILGRRVINWKMICRQLELILIHAQFDAGCWKEVEKHGNRLSNSPDLNPIENLWSIVKARLRTRDCTTKEKMICAVVQIWYHDAEIQEMCSKLVDSMQKRVALLLKATGGHIKY